MKSDLKEQNLSQKKTKKKIDRKYGFNCNHWTQEQCEAFLFVDMWDTLDDLGKRNWFVGAKIDKEDFEKLKNMSYFTLNTLYKGVLERAIEIARKTRNQTFLRQIFEIKKRARKEGLY